MEVCTLEDVRKVVMLEHSAKSVCWLADVNGAKYCLKEVAKEGLSQAEAENLLNEKKALQTLSHHKIIKLHRTFQDSAHIYFLLQLAVGAPLNHVIKSSRKFALNLTQSIIKQTAEILGYVHSRGFIYRDLKLSNVFLSAGGEVMLIDFGLCKEIGSLKEVEVSGTPHAMSPEMIGHLVASAREPVGYSYEVDWWALGILTYELLSGTPPFGLYNEDVYEKIIQGVSQVSFAEINPFAIDFIEKLLHPDPQLRLGHRGVEEVLSHTFLSSHVGVVQPNDHQVLHIRTWCEFLEDDAGPIEDDPFLNF
mmetsp:Transcript_15958/g.29218  ORF Transcript_15958/g.29218 Transcript_15958/m.29218 type:complete len:307 (+) Transcript_15958:2252-3172(+)